MNLSDNEAKMCMLEANSGLVRCLDSCTLPVNSKVILPVHISRRTQGEHVLLEPTQNLRSKKIMAARCVVQVGQGKSGIRLANPTNKRIHLPRRYVLANVIDINTDNINKLDEHSLHTMQANTEKPNRENIQFDLSQSDLTPHQKQQLTSFLHNQKHVFATNLNELGVARNYHHKIETDESPPIKMPCYRQPPPLQKETEKKIEEMLENNIITPSTSHGFLQ